MTQERPPSSDDDEARDRRTTNIFLIVMFIGSATRHVRRLNEQAIQDVYIDFWAPD